MIENLPEDVLMIIKDYVSINNLLYCNKNLYKLKKKFFVLELNHKDTVKFFKKIKFRNYIYSLIENPKKQLVLNIFEANKFDITERICINFDFNFNKNNDFKDEYVKILNNVYKYKFSCFHVNVDITKSTLKETYIFNKKFLNFFDLDVLILIKDFIVNNVNYDIEHILKNKNIKIKYLIQRIDTLCTDNYQQYLLYEKLKSYSLKYDIYFCSIEEEKLISIISSYDEDFLKMLQLKIISRYCRLNNIQYPFSFFSCNDLPELAKKPSKKLPASWRQFHNKNNPQLLIQKLLENEIDYTQKENLLRLLDLQDEYIQYINEYELPVLTNDYLQQMIPEYKKNTKNTKNRNRNRNRNNKTKK